MEIKKNDVEALNNIFKNAVYDSEKHIIKIGTPVSPAKITYASEIACTKILISYGGGMGGSREYIYTTDNITDDMLKKDKFTCHNFDGSECTVFTRFIVKVEKIKAVVIMGTHNNDNFFFKGRCFLVITEVGINEKYKVINDYIGDDSQKGNVIKSIFFW